MRAAGKTDPTAADIQSLYKSTDLAAVLASLRSAKQLKSLKQKGRVLNVWSNIGQRCL